MKIDKQDFKQLCNIARELNEIEQNELWQELNNIIENIEENTERKYKILDQEGIVTEDYLRDLLFEYTIENLVDNKKDYLKGIIQVDFCLNCINLSISGNIQEIINILENEYNIPIEEAEEI